jgi:citrate synthase
MAQGGSSASGLEGIIVAETRLSDVDGERGRLVIAGHDVESLAGAVPFEEICARLWSPFVACDANAVKRALGQDRVRAFEQMDKLVHALARRDGMDALRTATSSVEPSEDAFATSTQITAAMAVYAAVWSRRARGLTPIRPDPALPHSADLHRILIGQSDASRASGLDAYLVTVSDHGMNASTFAARVIASTASDAVSAIVGAIGALKGPLHGGAPGPVLDMLDAIGRPENAVDWLESELRAGRRIMGMGHRIYRVRDPRAAVLERAVERLERAGISTPRLALARAVERAAEDVLRKRRPDRPLRANVEFYTAVLLDAIGVDRAAFTPMFACGRVAGWLAHVMEQRASGRLIRPESRYTGPVPS